MTERSAEIVRLPNGLTPDQDAAFDALARALVQHAEEARHG